MSPLKKTPDSAPGAKHASEPFRILLVCEGNVCRSPTAAFLMRNWLDADMPGQFSVESAGTRALIGNSIEPNSAAQLPHGIDTSQFRARQLTTEMLKTADVVLAMDRSQRALSAIRYPKALHRSFTLREFGRMAAYQGSRAEHRSEAGPDGNTSAVLRWKELLVAAPSIRPFILAANPDDDDVADPYGGTVSDYKTALQQIVSATDGLRIFERGLSP